MEELTIKTATRADLNIIFDLIKEMATYERRPEDATGTIPELNFWLFERKIAKVLLAEIGKETIGYALFYPIFGSFSAKGKVHLEDLFIKEAYRGKGYGKILFNAVKLDALKNGYAGMEWSCLDWNTPSIEFYKHIGARQEEGRVYFEFSENNMKN